ncbi:hypothetical protein [Streptomyces sp. NPDC058739]|uniref:hypothetical protein n=1 Tax=Streptomyces sp. NPDC058739 TaxID=3346618 RepID=UPI0036992907
MPITPPSVPVLRGRGSTSLAFEGSALILRRRDEEIEIPLAAVARVHGARRVVEVQLRSPGGKPAAHRVEDVSDAAATAFVAAVNAALATVPEPAPDGSALVTVRTPDPGSWKARKRRTVRLLWAALLLVLCAETVTVTLVGDPVTSVVVWMLGLTTGVLAHAAVVTLPFGHRMWRLPKHGVTVVAQYGGYIDGMHIYDFADLNGNRFAYTPAGYRGDRVEVVYDPDDPLNGSARDLLVGRGTMLVLPVLSGFFALLGLVLTLLVIPLAIYT